MTSYGLTPDNISGNFPIGPSFGAPNYSVINNNGMDTRPLNHFDKTFQSSLQNQRDNQLGTAFIGGKGRRIRRSRVNKRRNTKRRCTNKKHRHNRTRARAKKQTTTHNKKIRTHSHSSYNQSYLSRKRKGGPKTMMRRLFFGRGEPLGYTMDTKNTDSLSGAMATPYPLVGYE